MNNPYRNAPVRITSIKPPAKRKWRMGLWLGPVVSFGALLPGLLRGVIPSYIAAGIVLIAYLWLFRTYGRTKG